MKPTAGHGGGRGFGSREYRLIYQRTQADTPVEGDCGRLCGDACCRHPGGQQNGLYLLPGEDCMFTRQEPWLTWDTQDAAEYRFPDSWEGPVWFLGCTGRCDRDRRPLQCRTYPAAPHLDLQGRFLLVLDTQDAGFRCPLVSDPVWHSRFSEHWLHGLYQAWGLLLNDPRIYDLVWMDSGDRAAAPGGITVLYGPGGRRIPPSAPPEDR